MQQSQTPATTFAGLVAENRPQGAAWVGGAAAAARLSGLVKFYDTIYGGVLIETEIFGLPNISSQGSSDFYALHIHETGDCSHQFAKTGNHYNPAGLPHPQHAGDLLPLLGNQGYAWGAFYDKRFQIKDILGRSVVIHRNRDDFTSQPAGDAGEKIGCGVIVGNP